MSTGDFPSGRWQGQWIAAEVPELAIDPTSLGGDLPSAGFSRVQFRRTFELATDAGIPDRVPLRVSADSRYLLWVNDVEVGRGPVRSQPRRLRYVEYDIARLLRAGRNVVAVLVTYYGSANSFWQPAASSGVMGPGRAARPRSPPRPCRSGRGGLAGHRRRLARPAVGGLAGPGVGPGAGGGADRAAGRS